MIHEHVLEDVKRIYVDGKDFRSEVKFMYSVTRYTGNPLVIHNTKSKSRRNSDILMALQYQSRAPNTGSVDRPAVFVDCVYVLPLA